MNFDKKKIEKIRQILFQDILKHKINEDNGSEFINEKIELCDYLTSKLYKRKQIRL